VSVFHAGARGQWKKNEHNRKVGVLGKAPKMRAEEDDLRVSLL